MFCKIKDLAEGGNAYNVYVKVVSAEPKTVEEGRNPLMQAVVADETGSADAFFKGENVKLIKKGSVVAIRNGTIKYIKNHISLEVDLFGRITPETIDIKEIIDPNISANEIARKPRRPRSRNVRGDGRRGDRRNDRRNDYDRRDNRRRNDDRRNDGYRREGRRNDDRR